MPKIDMNAVPQRTGTNYPEQFSGPMQGRIRQRLGDAAGLTQFGVNLLQLPPGGWSAQRHWHTHEDEFVYIVSGEVVLVTDEGEQVLRTGDCAGFPAGEPSGHHLVNRSNAPAVCLEVGTRNPKEDGVDYPDIDMICEPGREGYSHRDGRPY